MLIIDADSGAIVDANQAASDFYGWPVAELKRMRIQQINTLTAEEVRAEMEKARLMRRITFEFRHRRADGSIRDVSVYSNRIDVRGTPLLYSIIHDSTERKQAERSLREISENFSVAFNNAPLMMAISSFEDGTYYDVNRIFLETTGFTREEVIGRTSVDLGWISADDRTMLKDCMLRNGRLEGVELHLRPKSGSTLLCRVWGETIHVAGQSRFFSVVQDITEQKLIERRFFEAQKLESVGRLAGGVAHDFNNMLGVILGHAELALLSGHLSPPLRRHLEEIHEAAKRSAGITKQLLAFARRQMTEPRLLNLDDTVAGMLKMLKRLIGEDIELNWNPGCRQCCVKIDPAQLDQVMANLCLNARDAINGIGRLDIHTGRVVPSAAECRQMDIAPGEYLLVSVADNGSGMEPEVVEHIFEPFYSTKEFGAGTGLGLATVFGIVNQNGGHIAVDSEPGRGTLFRIYLPASTGEAPGALQATQEEPARMPRGAGQTVLAVEDDTSILDMSASFLAALGYQVLTAGTPAAALAIARARTGTIDLLITDIIMPGMNGRDLSKRLQEMLPGLKCLYMSGYTADILANRGNIVDDVEFLQKPFSIQHFAEKVRETLEKGWAPQ